MDPVDKDLLLEWMDEESKQVPPQQKSCMVDVTEQPGYWSMDYSQTALLLQKKGAKYLDEQAQALKASSGNMEDSLAKCKTVEDLTRWYKVYFPHFDDTTCAALAASTETARLALEKNPHDPLYQRFLKKPKEESELTGEDLILRDLAKKRVVIKK